MKDAYITDEERLQAIREYQQWIEIRAHYMKMYLRENKRI